MKMFLLIKEIKMKVQSFLATCLLMVGLAQGQSMNERQVPAVVLNAFQQKFPKAKDVEWEKKSQYYEVSFELGWKFTDHEVWISPEGRIIQHQEDISTNDLPKAIKDVIRTKYKGFRIEDVDRIYRGKEVIYQVELEKGREELKKQFQPNGTEM
jgi:hypothetical protein